jgi:hypothetical protein
VCVAAEMVVSSSSSDIVLVSIALCSCCGLFFLVSSLCSVSSWSGFFVRSFVLGFCLFLETCFGLGPFLETCLGLVCVAAEMVVSSSFLRVSSLCSVCHLGPVFRSLVLVFCLF